MSDKLKKILIIAIPVAVVVIALIIGAIFLFGGKDEYRSVKVYSVDGSATVTVASGETITPYENMLLEANSSLETKADSRIYLKLDDDKYLMVAPSSSITLSASGNSKDSKTTISLNYGEVVVHVTDPLSDASSFEVKTATSTMAIRGTSFAASTTTSVTALEVFEGTVGVVTNSAAQETPISAGTAISITEGGIYGDPVAVDYESLDDETLEFLKIAIDEGKDLGITKDEIDDIIESRKGSLLVSFVFEYKNGDTVVDTPFATKRVASGETVDQPILRPTPNGRWDFDFSTPITKNTVIHWIAE